MTGDFGRGEWTVGGHDRVAPGVYRIPLPLPNDGLRAVNVYATEDDDGLVLIDAGWALLESIQRLESGLAEIGHDLGEVHTVLVTHIHHDHYTQALSLRRLFGSRVYLGAGERPGLEHLRSIGTNVPIMMLDKIRRHGAPDLASALTSRNWGRFDPDDWELPDDWITAGRITLSSRVLSAIPTPGHTRGHVVFLDAEAGLLFSGDHVLPHITPSIGFESVDESIPLADYLDSLRLVACYSDARLLPAHGPPGDSVHRRVDELLAHHERRLAESLAAFTERRSLNAHHVARKLTWTSRHRPFTDLDAFNQMLAVNETAAHLDVLAVRGELRAHHENTTVLYTLAREQEARHDGERGAEPPGRKE